MQSSCMSGDGISIDTSVGSVQLQATQKEAERSLMHGLESSTAPNYMRRVSEAAEMGACGDDQRSSSSSDAETSSADFHEYVQQLGRAGGELTFVVSALVLSSFGSFMGPSSLWVCWAIPLLKLLMDYSIRSSWLWIISYLSSRIDIRSHQTASAPHDPCSSGAGSCTGCAAARQADNYNCRFCAPSGLTLTPADGTIGQRAPAVLKIALAIVLLVNSRDLKLSAGCSASPPCSDRAKESMLGLVLLIIVVEGIPAMITSGFKLMDGTDIYRSAHLFWHAFRDFWWDNEQPWLHSALILQSFHASASSAVIVVTGSLLVGGNFGSFMTRRCFWLCWLIIVVELLAEGFCPIAVTFFRYCKPRREGGDVENMRLVEQAIAKLVIRVPAHATLCSLLIQVLVNHDDYPPDLDPRSCDSTCRGNTRALLTVICIFTSGQMLTVLPIWAPFQISLALLPSLVADVLLSILTGFGPWAVRCFVAYAVFRGGNMVMFSFAILIPCLEICIGNIVTTRILNKNPMALEEANKWVSVLFTIAWSLCIGGAYLSYSRRSSGLGIMTAVYMVIARFGFLIFLMRTQAARVCSKKTYV